MYPGPAAALLEPLRPALPPAKAKDMAQGNKRNPAQSRTALRHNL